MANSRIPFFELPRLEYIDVSENYGLVGRFAGFHRGSLIKSLQLYETNFTGELPVWMGNLSYLTDIDISKCRFWGEIPSYIGHLTSLKSFDLGFNQFHGTIPPSIGNLTGLILLSFDKNWLSGDIPSSLGNLVQLQMLQLSGNQLKGEVPSSLVQLPQLFSLDLSSNMQTGIVPTQIGNRTLLAYLDLSSNKLYGPLPISAYQLWSLWYLNLSLNTFTGAARFDLLNRVREVYLSSNAFSSIIFPEPGASLSQSSSDLSHNHIQRTPPIQPYSISFFFIPNNRISGEIPPSICEMWNMRILDLAENNLSGVLPLCLGNLSSTLWALSLSGNNIAGKIPEFNSVKCELDTIDLSSNSFEGPLPMSFASCRKLKYMNFGSNKIVDSFPSWLGSLPSLMVLILHSNRIYGEIKPPRNESTFPSLKVISLSDNLFWGTLPADYFPHWLAMKYFSAGDAEYPDSYVRIVKMTIIDKGIEREFGKTTGYFTLLDLSSNNFSGTILESIGDDLLMLHTLNLSTNQLTGLIPQSLANLRNLEVLDLSQNRLFGKIPGTLKQITSPAIFNVSYNNLTGSIPGDNQFGTFDNSSYIGNPGLCGAPLTKRCGNSPQFPLCSGHDQEGLPFGFMWITTMAGLMGGLVVGVALEQAFGAAVLCRLVRNWRKYGR